MPILVPVGAPVPSLQPAAPFVELPYFAPADLVLYANSRGPIAQMAPARIDQARLATEATIERVCGTSFVTRQFTEVVPASSGRVRLSRAYVTALLGISVGGVDMTPDQLAGFAVSASGYLTPAGYVDPSRSSSYGYGYGGDCGTLLGSSSTSGGSPMSVTYLAGATAEPPADLLDAAMEATRFRLVDRDVQGRTARALSIQNEQGQINLASASLARPFGLPDVDAVVLGYRQHYRATRTA